MELGDIPGTYCAEDPAVKCENFVFLHTGFLLHEALMRNGVNTMAAHYHVDLLRIQNLVNVHQGVAIWPVNARQESEERVRQLAEMNQENVAIASKTFFPELFKSVPLMSERKAKELLDNLAEEVQKDTEKGLYMQM